MNTQEDERIAVVAAAGSVGVSITMGDVIVTIRSPCRSSDKDDAQHVREAALRDARRALEVALQEMRLSN